MVALLKRQLVKQRQSEWERKSPDNSHSKMITHDFVSFGDSTRFHVNKGGGNASPLGPGESFPTVEISRVFCPNRHDSLDPTAQKTVWIMCREEQFPDTDTTKYSASTGIKQHLWEPFRLHNRRRLSGRFLPWVCVTLACKKKRLQGNRES